MEIYELTSTGRGLAHSTRSPDTPEWKVIYFLAKQGRATKDQIQSFIPSATSATLAKLRIKRIIQDAMGVNV